MKFSKKVLREIYVRITKSMSGFADISVVLEPNVCPNYNWATKTISMPPVISYARNDDEDFLIGRGVVVHEAGHVIFLPVMPMKKEKDWYEWFNVFADSNNEFKTVEIFPHLKKPLVDKTQIIFEVKPEALVSDNPFMQACMRVSSICKIDAKYPTDYNPLLTKFVDEVVIDFNIENIKSCSGQDLLAFTDKIQERWKKLLKENEELKKAMDGLIRKANAEYGKAIASGDKAAIAAAKAGLDKAKVDAKSGCKAFEVKDGVDSKLITKHNTGKGTAEHDYSKMSLEELKKMLLEKVEKVSKVTTEHGWGTQNISTCEPVVERHLSHFRKSNGFKHDDKTAHTNGKKINHELRKKVKIMEDFENKHRNGRLDFENVREQVGKYGRIIKENVFSRELNFAKEGEWAVSILLDMSGSMSVGSKMFEAKTALATLGYALDNLPNVKFEMYGFSSDSSVLDIPIKKYSDKFSNKLFNNIQPYSGNADGINIRYAGRRLLKHANKKKILFVISDGQPAYEIIGRDGIEDTTKAVLELERKQIKVVGIGIPGATEASLKTIYKNHYLFKQANNSLCNDLVNLILSCLGQNKKEKLIKSRWEI